MTEREKLLRSKRRVRNFIIIIGCLCAFFGICAFGYEIYAYIQGAIEMRLLICILGAIIIAIAVSIGILLFLFKEYSEQIDCLLERDELRNSNANEN